MLPADLYVRTTSDTGSFAPRDQRAIAALPGVARAEFMDLHVPWLVLGGLCAALLALATLAARVAARSATSVDAVRAVREDW